MTCWVCSLFQQQAAGVTGAHVTAAPQQQEQLQQQPLPMMAPGLQAQQVAALPSPAAAPVPTTQPQQQPDDFGDCLGCRVTGLMLGLGGAGYVSSRLFEHPKPVGAHKYTLIGMSVGLFALGIGRAIGF